MSYGFCFPKESAFLRLAVFTVQRTIPLSAGFRFSVDIKFIAKTVPSAKNRYFYANFRQK
jgi:hypothetical protein